MSTALFRQEAIEYHRSTPMGEVRIATPPVAKWFAMFGAAIIFAVALIMFFGTYANHNVVNGKIVPSRGVLGIRNQAPGTVVKELVREGDHVHKGDELIQLSSEQASASGATRAAIADQLALKRAELEKSIEIQKKQYLQQQQDLQIRQDFLKDEIAQFGREAVMNHIEVDKSELLMKQIAPLVGKGYVSKIQMQTYGSTLNQLKARSIEIARSKLETLKQLEELAEQLRDAPQKLELSIGETRRQIFDIDRELAENELQRSQVLHAAADGIVTAVQVKLGQTVGSNEILMSILPDNSKLIGEVLVPGKAMADLHVGSGVTLRYDAYPVEQYGHFPATVSQITRVAISHSEAESEGVKEQKDALYKVELNLGSEASSKEGPPALRPGLEFEADIFSKKRRIYQWILSPLYTSAAK